MQFVHHNMVSDRETIPKHPVGHPVKIHLFHYRDIRSMAHTAGKGIVTAVDAEGIDLAFSGSQKMSYTVVYRIEKSLRSKGLLSNITASLSIERRQYK